MALTTYTPSAADATGNARTFPAASEEATLAASPYYGSAKWHYKPLADEVLQLIRQDQTTYCTADYSRTSTTSQQPITGMSLTLVAGKKYAIDGIFFTAIGDGGHKMDWYGGTVGASSFIIQQDTYNGSGITTDQATALNTEIIVSTTSVMAIRVSGYIAATAAGATGTLVPRFAQASSNGASSTVKAGSWLRARMIG
ncbi:MAG TPA: hypothetical protein VGP72_10505 [Planctomycetota bacterium]|jgi:hypothetical protein